MALLMKAWWVAVPLQTTRGARQGWTPRELLMIFWVDSTVWLEVEESGAKAFYPCMSPASFTHLPAMIDDLLLLGRLSLQEQHTHDANKVERRGWFIFEGMKFSEFRKQQEANLQLFNCMRRLQGKGSRAFYTARLPGYSSLQVIDQRCVQVCSHFLASNRGMHTQMQITQWWERPGVHAMAMQHRAHTYNCFGHHGK